MILTGAKLEEIGRALYGRTWPTVMADRLRRARRALFNYRDEAAPIPPIMREQLRELLDDQMATLAALKSELAEDQFDPI